MGWDKRGIDVDWDCSSMMATGWGYSERSVDVEDLSVALSTMVTWWVYY